MMSFILQSRLISFIVHHRNLSFCLYVVWVQLVIRWRRPSELSKCAAERRKKKKKNVSAGNHEAALNSVRPPDFIITEYAPRESRKLDRRSNSN